MSAVSSTAQTLPRERRLALLEQLAELGIGLVQAMKADVEAAHDVQAQVAREDPTCRLFPPFDFAETAQAFARISRAVRLTLALHARLEAGAVRPYPVFRAQPAHPSAARRPPSNTAAPGASGEMESRERLSDPDELNAWFAQPADPARALPPLDLDLAPSRAAMQARQSEAPEADHDLADDDAALVARPPAQPLSSDCPAQSPRARGP
jgi:hypothetical protein